MKILDNIDECCGCYACYSACPVHAIDMRINDNGFRYPEVKADKCIQCGKCQRSCPITHKASVYQVNEAYGCIAKDANEHSSSSSGGIFAVLAREFFKSDGIVCGAAFDENFNVHHIIVNNEDELFRLKETKYVQSCIEDCYSEIMVNLQHDKYVLFSGTPCQVAGLKCFLGKEYERLLCVEVICHGVPSPAVWQKHLSEISEGKKLRSVSFRNKTKGISKVTLDYHFIDGTLKQEAYDESAYIKGFIQNLYMRPSCASCHFKRDNSFADIIIGDFWGIEEFHPGFSDGYGTSAVIINSDKGKFWFEIAKQRLRFVVSDRNSVGAWNTSLDTSPQWNENEEKFFSVWKRMTLNQAVELLKKTPDTKNQFKLFAWVKGKVKKWLV